VLEKVLVSGESPQAILGLNEPGYVERMQRDPREAQALAACLDLSAHRAVLDVGRGSGVMSIALAKRNPHLRACILDVASVCEIAARNARRARLSRRVTTLAGDIRQALPVGYDVVLLCDIGAVPAQLLKNAWRCLPPGGLLILVDRYLSDDGTRPLDRLVAHFTGASFGLATRRDMVQALKACGFRAVMARKFYQDARCITGVKPGRQLGRLLTARRLLTAEVGRRQSPGLPGQILTSHFMVEPEDFDRRRAQVLADNLARCIDRRSVGARHGGAALGVEAALVEV
jgi:SAM-dependent methyltransferase